ncbi:MAG TPA: S8 family serine peptidase [Pirellulales bacterium]|nr:S8 family serine peptidase [Pirellulales bacterium]
MSVRKRAGLSSGGKHGAVTNRVELAIEQLEDLSLLSTTPAATAQTDWRDETYSIGSVDQQVYSGDLAQASGTTGSALPLIGGTQEQQQYGYNGAGYSIAILDTGIDYNNPAFAGRYLGGWNFVANNNNPMDDNGHGTHVAGIIASADPNHLGVAPGVNIIALKVLDSTGTGSFGNVDLALQWVAQHQQQYHIAAVNMSLGAGNFASTEPWTMLDSDLETLRNDGVFVAASSGNSYYSYGSQPGLAFPAINNLVVSVGAVWNGNYGSVTWADGAQDYTTASDQITSFTQRSLQLDILAPGAFITSTYLNDTFATMAGTSMASPVVAAAAVDIREALDSVGRDSQATPQEILSIMQGTGVSIVDAGHGQDNVTHTGETYQRLDLLNAIQSIVGAGSTPAPSPPSQPTPSPTPTDPTSSYVDAIYREVLGRAVDPAGLSTWVHDLESGLSRYDFVRALWDSAEHRAQEVEADYQEFLHRSAGPADVNYWVGVFERGASETAVAGAFMYSPEYLYSHADNAGFIQEVFQDQLGRTADGGSVSALSNALNAGMSRIQLVNLVLDSPERTDHVIEGYYEQYLGRSGSAAELQGWSEMVDAGLFDFESVAEQFLSSNEYFNAASAHDHSAAFELFDTIDELVASAAGVPTANPPAESATLGNPQPTADASVPAVQTAASPLRSDLMG